MRQMVRKPLLIIAAGYILLSLLLFWIVKEDWTRTAVVTDTVDKGQLLGEMREGSVIEQTFTVCADKLTQITIEAEPIQANEANRKISVTLVDGDEQLWHREYDVQTFVNNAGVCDIGDGVLTGKKGKKITLQIEGNGGIALWCGETRSAGKFSVATESSGTLKADGEPMPGELVMKQAGEVYLPYMRYYWPVAAGLFVLIMGVLLWAHRCRVKGKPNKIVTAYELMQHYSYLLKTLVVRDFRIKYQASVLGVLWSFLNPLLMTFVYMFVFSTIFRSSIDHFVAYLMSGIVLFNYFSESTNLGMASIVGNAGLITKVYIPKYIFPVSKALSAAINLSISFIPLLVMMAVTGVAFHKSMLLIPLVVLFLMVFCIGMSLILSSGMVYFRDTQFLWGILLTIWNFVSPIFYPESIIPARFITIYRINPIYQYLYFLRTITIGGISPTPVTYLYCILASTAALALGLFVFKKAQNKFVLHL